jgi:tetratricopeptide (TPR) repeat protein
LPLFSRAITRLTPLNQKESGREPLLSYLRSALEARADVLDQLKRPSEAIPDWDKAIELAAEPDRSEFRMKRAFSRARAGQLDTALKEVEELAKNGNYLAFYNAGCLFAIAAGRLSEKDAELSKEECATRAVGYLQQAIAKGWKHAEQMKKDEDLKALRERDDFKKLLADLEQKSR